MNVGKLLGDYFAFLATMSAADLVTSLSAAIQVLTDIQALITPPPPTPPTAAVKAK